MTTNLIALLFPQAVTASALSTPIDGTSTEEGFASLVKQLEAATTQASAESAFASTVTSDEPIPIEFSTGKADDPKTHSTESSLFESVKPESSTEPQPEGQNVKRRKTKSSDEFGAAEAVASTIASTIASTKVHAEADYQLPATTAEPVFASVTDPSETDDATNIGVPESSHDHKSTRLSKSKRGDQAELTGALEDGTPGNAIFQKLGSGSKTATESILPVDTGSSHQSNNRLPESVSSGQPDGSSLALDMAIDDGSVVDVQASVSDSELQTEVIEVAPGRNQTLSSNLAGQVNEVVQRVAFDNRSDRKSMRVEIRPPDLGHMTIQVDQTADKMIAEIVASEVVTAEMLTHEKDFLLEALAELGFSETEVDIRHGNEQQDARQHPFSQSHQTQVDIPVQDIPKLTSSISTSDQGVDLIA